MAEFQTVANVSDVAPGSATTVTINGELIAIVNCDGQFYAINNICSHAYAELAEGEVDADECTIECPLHGSLFSLETGRPRTLPAITPVATYPIQIVGDEIQVAV